MAGALMQLVAYGSQDIYLSAEPTITFWKAVYRRYTNFSIEAIEQTFSGNPVFGSKVVCKIGRNGDLISNTYVLVTMPDITGTGNYYVNRVGFNLLKEVELRIGGQMIDRMYSTWMHIWTELTHTKDKKDLLDKMVGAKQMDGINTLQTNPGRLYIPLFFAYCRHQSLALPLIAMQYHEVEIHISFETLKNCLYDRNINININAELSNVSLLIDYIFLDTEERKEFAQKTHEYLIEIVQSQTSSISKGMTSTRLTFNHPTKFISWVMREPLYSCHYVEISANHKSVLAIKDDGTLWGWGWSINGILSPTQISANTWMKIKVGGEHSIAIKNDGSLWGTGSNMNGQLGLGNNGLYYNEFTQIGTEYWKDVSCGFYHTMVIKTDGTLWAFGYNASGQLGLNDTTNRYYPTQVGTDLWKNISCNFPTNMYIGNTIGIKIDGSIWSWGNNIFYQLGLGDTITRLVPTQIGTDTDWYNISCGSIRAFALKNNGTIWGWGIGPLGLGDIMTRQVPTQIGTDTDWMKINSDNGHTVAIKTNNTVYSWGANGVGQLGLGDTIIRLVPTFIGTWSNFFLGGFFTFLLDSDNNLYGSGNNDTGQLRLGYSNYLTTFTPIPCQDSDIFTGFSSYVSNTTLKLNGQDRFANRDSTFFNYIQPYQHFSGKPDVGINVYSFAVKPEEHQPSGTCNFSRIDNVNLDITTNTNLELLVYGFSYNILRVASGMAGLAFSN
jgi:alpha-tubulin suppressor-like RCC1 family protein